MSRSVYPKKPLASDQVEVQFRANRRPNLALVQARLERGWSRNQMADQLSQLAATVGESGYVNERTIKRWEDGDRDPWPRNVRLLCLLFGRSPDGLGLGPVLDAEAILAAELAVVASEKVHRGLAGGRVDADVLSSIRERIRQLWRLDDLLGGGPCSGLADSDMRLVLSLLERARYDEATEHRLYVFSAELARFAGWAAFDAGRHAEAQQYWQAGLKAAERGQDPGILAYLLSNLAMQATYAGDGRRAVDLLEAARHRAGTSVSFTVRAMLDAWQVRAHAVLRQPREAAHLLHRADELWERRVPSDDPMWIYWMTRPSLTAEAGLAFLALGQSQTAEQLLVDGLNALPADSQRDRILYLGGIAEARLAQHGAVDGALEAANEAVALASRLGSSRAVDQLSEFDARVVSRYRRAPAVKMFHERLQVERGRV